MEDLLMPDEPTRGGPSPEANAAIPAASTAILELLENEAVSFGVQSFVVEERHVYSPIAQQVIEVVGMPEGSEKKGKEKGIIDKISEKIQTSRSIADKLRADSFSLGVGFPFGVQISFSWTTTKNITFR